MSTNVKLRIGQISGGNLTAGSMAAAIYDQMLIDAPLRPKEDPLPRQRFAISSLDEARAYLAHSVLGPRLRECAATVLATSGQTALEIFGSIDAVKLRSSMTLFHRAAPDEPVFAQVLERYYDGRADDATDARLGLR